ncbi:MAG: tetratricopeptide repeat protein [Verrucomicrobiota bacterium]|nr:tetratricopeptide repeat protein [Verrucomicrobiota bacterium]
MKKILPLLFLGLATFGVYAPGIRNGFVWDDTALVLRDPFIRSWRLIPEGFQHFLFTDATASDFYRPLQRLSYTLDYAAFGFRPSAFHLTSVAIHFLAVVALFFFAMELLRGFALDERRATLTAFVAALVWAIHPALTSAVAYISGRADSLAALFGFAGLYVSLLAAGKAGYRGWLLNGLCALLLLLSALSKEAGLVFPILWVALLLLQRKTKAIFPAAVAIAFTIVIYGVLRVSAEHTAAPPPQSIPLLVRPILIARAIAEYAGLIVFPLHLHMDRDVETHPFGFSSASMTVAAWRELQTIAGLLILAALIFWCLRAWKRDRVVAVFLILTAITYLPISGLILLNATIAEHWLYLPAAFFFVAIASMLTRHRLGLCLIASWSLFLGARTFIRCYDWKDQRTFLERTLADGGDSARMLINLGALESSENHLDEAKKDLAAALQKEPEQPLAIIDLAAVAVKQNDFTAAHELLERATKMPLVEAQAYELLAILESKENNRANVMRMRLASRTGAPNWSIEKRYIKLLDEVGGTDAAVAELKHCLETQWYRADSWKLLSELLAKSGHAQESVNALAQARRYDVRLAASTASVSAPR